MEYTDIMNRFNKLTITTRKPLLNGTDVHHCPSNTMVSDFRGKTESNADKALKATLFNKAIVTPPSRNIFSEPNSIHSVRRTNLYKTRARLDGQHEKVRFPIILDEEDTPQNNQNERNRNSTETNKPQDSDTPKKRPEKKRECARRFLLN